jgi:TetR/AcrR family transcriptional repressor of nem operon
MSWVTGTTAAEHEEAMGRLRNTKKEILDAAEELLQVRGFGGFSYHHIADQLGVRNAAVHYHFPTKSDLGVALVQRYREGFVWWIEQLRVQQAAASECLERFFSIERRYLREGRVCPLGVVGVEYVGVPEEMRQAAKSLLEEVAAWLEGVLDRGRRESEFGFTGDARARAWTILGALQGGLQLARLNGEEVLDCIIQQLHDDLRPAGKIRCTLRAISD